MQSSSSLACGDNRPAAAFIDSADTLADILPQLIRHGRVAIDTEADSLHCYFEKLCLVQISVPEFDCIIDPLAGFPLDPLFSALTGKELIIHGADYDLRLLRRVGYPGPARIFDTMIAARLCGIAEFSLAALIRKYIGLQLIKGSQKANWARRPLPRQMLEYAANDTRHLHRLTEILETELHRLGRWTWFEQSCERAIGASAVTRERDLEQAWRVTGSNDFRGRSAAILRALWQWREEEAQRIDRPAFHILHNEQLLQAAAALSRGAEVEFPHLQGGRRRRFYTAVELACALAESEWPKFTRTARLRPSKEEEDRFKELKTRRDKIAAELQVDPALIASKSVLENLAASPEETAARMLPWQREILGI
ncbi:MAG: HRDC domain-containing protein [Verrucomicrobiota bacterium]|nr:HRDC domain-containing protein [Verrucomicrobiota bacterium]